MGAKLRKHAEKKSRVGEKLGGHISPDCDLGRGITHQNKDPGTRPCKAKKGLTCGENLASCFGKKNEENTPSGVPRQNEGRTGWMKVGRRTFTTTRVGRRGRGVTKPKKEKEKKSNF